MAEPKWISTLTSPNVRSGSSSITSQFVDVGRKPNLTFDSTQFTVIEDDVYDQNVVKLTGNAGNSPLTSSVGAFAELSTYSNYTNGQNLGAPNAWNVITQWLTASLQSPGIVATTNAITASQAGLYMHMASFSFSGSAGIYTFGMFEGGVLDVDSVQQMTVASGQPFPVHVTLSHMDFHSSIPIQHDIRVQCSNAGANFQMNYGNFCIYRVVG